MYLKPDRGDLATIFHFLGRITLLLSVLVFLSAGVSLIAGEHLSALRIATGGIEILMVGLCLNMLFKEAESLSLPGSMAFVAVVWIWAMLLIGWVYWLTGHFASYTDACFDAISGFTTTGLALIQDVDHASEGLQFLRHLITFVGGQGIVTLFLAILAKSSPMYFQMYSGEGKDERLWPNVLHTSRVIRKISLVYLSAGTLALSLSLYHIGFTPWRAFFDGLYLFASSWSTGGFAPHTQNLLYYHSPLIELITMAIFVVGSLNFLIHYHNFTGNLREMLKNTEVRFFVFSSALLAVCASFACFNAGIYPSLETAFKKVFYQIYSAHTTTGTMTIYSRQFINDWPVSATLAIIAAMAIGGSACSTAGGIKGIRMAQIGKGVWLEIKKTLLPASALATVRFHHGQTRLLTPQVFYKASMIGILFIALYAITTFAGVLAGYPLLDSFFEGVSAASNSGLSCGITCTSMPWGLKVVYIFAMWLGRLEFLAAFILLGYIVIWAVGK